MKCFIKDNSKNVYHNMECPECGQKLLDRYYYDRYDPATEETYRVYHKYHVCKCGYMDASYEALWGKLMVQAREKRWSEWIASQITSFKDVEDNFYTRNQVLNMIRNYKGKKNHNCSKKQQIYYLDMWCLHFVLWGRKFYLKKSVKKYLYCRNGLFPLKKGFKR